MDNNSTIIELEAQISALKKQLKTIAQENAKKDSSKKLWMFRRIKPTTQLLQGKVFCG